MDFMLEYVIARHFINSDVFYEYINNHSI